MDYFIKFLKSIRPTNILVVFAILGLSLILRRMFSQKLILLFLIATGGGYLLFLIRGYIDWQSPRVQQILITMLILMVCYYLGKSIGTGKYNSVLLIVAGIYLALLFKKPEYILLITMILVTNMFVLYNPERFGRIRGMFKLRDLLLMSLFIPLILRDTVLRKRIRFLIDSPVAKAILGLLFMVLMFIILTVIRYSYSFNLSFRIARDFFYYIFFFAVVYTIRTKKQLDFILRSMIALSILFAIMYIIQAIGGGYIKVFPGYTPPLGKIGGYPLLRSYISFGFAGLVMLMLIGTISFLESNRGKIFSLLGIGVLLLAYFFTFGRSGWYGAGISILIIFILLPISKKRVFIRRFLGLSATFILLMVLVGAIRYGTPEALLTLGSRRVASAPADFIGVRGTFEARMVEVRGFYENVVKRHPIIGGGFLYPGEIVMRIFGEGVLTYGHCAVISILNNMGAIGLLYYLFLYFIFVKRGIFIIKRINNNFYKGCIIAFVSMYISIWTGSLTAGSLINYASILIVSLILGLTEVMYKIDQEEQKSKFLPENQT